jgi:hypothetical protein
MKIRLWFIRETQHARLYCKLPPERHPTDADYVWVPRSVIEGCMKFPTGECHLELADWFAEKENL